MSKKTILKVALIILIFIGMFLIPEFLEGEARRIAQLGLFAPLLIIGLAIIRRRRHGG